MMLEAKRYVHRGRRGAVGYEVTWFRLNFDNQLVQASQAGGASSQLTNAGKTLKEGVEVGGDIDLGGGFSVGGNYTRLPTARLQSMRIVAAQTAGATGCRTPPRIC